MCDEIGCGDLYQRLSYVDEIAKNCRGSGSGRRTLLKELVVVVVVFSNGGHVPTEMRVDRPQGALCTDDLVKVAEV